MVCFLCKEPNNLLIIGVCSHINGHKICLGCELKLHEAKNKALSRPVLSELIKEKASENG